MNSKTVLILKRLIDGRPCRIAELAECLEISQRLVRYEMAEANAFLEREGFPLLQNARSAGVKLTLEPSQRAELEAKLSNLDAREYVMTSEERCCVITLMFLASGGEPLTSQYFADQLGVSKSSIDKDMTLLKAELASKGFRLETKTRKGSTLVGDEQSLRQYGVHLLEQRLDFAKLYQGGDQSRDIVERWARHLFCGDLTDVFQLVRSLEENTLCRWLSYDSFRMLTLTLAVMLVRIRGNRIILEEPATLRLVKTCEEYVYALQLAEKLQETFSIALPPGEVYTLAILLACIKCVPPESYRRDDWVGIQILVDRIVHDMSQELGVDFTGDEAVYDSLQSHLGPTVFRLRQGISISNPNLQIIKRTYTQCFNALERVIDHLRSDLLPNISEDEIAYLVLHFCAAIERQKRIQPVSRVAIVCMYGVATANLLREFVCTRFKNIRVVATTTHADLPSIESMDIDFIITSIPLPGCGIPWVKVETLPTAEDLETIGRMTLKYRDTECIRDSTADLFSGIMRAVDTHCDIKDMDALMKALSDCFEENGLPLRIDRIQPTLTQLLGPDKIRCRLHARDWEDAISQGCQVLIDAGDVTEAYTQSVTKSIRSAGPYMVIMPGVALVHSEVGKGILQLSAALVTFHEGVCFHHPSHDPVKLALFLAPVDSWSHIRVLHDFLNLLNSVSVEALCCAENPQELWNLLKGNCE